jgi:hypothetical protein
MGPERSGGGTVEERGKGTGEGASDCGPFPSALMRPERVSQRSGCLPRALRIESPRISMR